MFNKRCINLIMADYALKLYRIPDVCIIIMHYKYIFPAHSQAVVMSRG